MKRRAFVGAAVLGCAFPGVRPVFAQTIDIPTLADEVTGLAPEDLLDGLRKPFRESLLPHGFAAIDDPGTSLQRLADDFDSVVASITGNEGTATHLFEVERSLLPSTFGNALLSYLVLDHDIDATGFSDLAQEFPLIFANRGGDDGELGEIEIGGVDAARVYITSREGQSHRDMMVAGVPIASVLLFASVIITNRKPIDDDDLDAACLDLAMAGAGWLAAVLNDLE